MGVRATVSRSRPAPVLVTAALVAAAVLSGCAGPDSPAMPGSSPATTVTSRSTGRAVTAFPAGQPFDYQIGGSFRPDASVRVVSRDRGDRPDPARYSVCYVNAYQIQPRELGWWQAHHPHLLLRDGGGRPVVDADWDEALLDLRTAANRSTVVDIVGTWLEGCADAGFRAAELDNLDSYLRSKGLLTPQHAVALASELAAVAHREGLAVGQKNAPELATRLAAAGYDFAVAEECAEYDECGDYTAAYGRAVVDIEYTRAAFREGCRDPGRPVTTLRDRDVSPPGEPGFVDERC